MKTPEDFKKYVHERLDKMGIPSDPEPENNAKHGCRIEGRLNYIENKHERMAEALKELLPIAEELGNYYYTKPEAAVSIKAVCAKASKLIEP